MPKFQSLTTNRPIANIVRAYLEPEGYTVHTAANGPAALKTVRSFRHDLVVLDIMVPILDGIEVLRRVRQRSDIHVRRALLFRLHRRRRPS